MFLMSHRGFSLIEILVSVAILSLFVLGIYSGIEFTFRVVFQSRVRIIENSILNEQIELIRNLPFADVGIINGSPSGVLTRTVTSTRDGTDFVVIRTIRNIDDPYDGTIDGTPEDTSPADYKEVYIEVSCASCRQVRPASASTIISPKYLEGDPDNGALFIQVLDADADPVQGASVHVVATTTSTTIDLVDTTNNDGMLYLVDLPSGVSVYSVTVTKVGYTSDQTITPTEANPNPTKPPITVSAQDVTEVSFFIDEVSTLAISTVNALCQPVGGVPVSVTGNRVIGSDPTVYVNDTDITTNGSGAYTLTSSWDTFTLEPTGYDLLGTIPRLSAVVLPGESQPISLVLGANTAASLLTVVTDAINAQPVSGATVQVVGVGYDETIVTDVGHVRQTDWSGGSGQEQFTNDIQFWSETGIDALSSVGNLTLDSVGGGQYTPAGELESSTIDLGLAAEYVNLIWEPIAQPIEAGLGSVRFQLASSNSSTPASWDFVGPDGTAETYYTSSDTVVGNHHNGNQYLRYKVFLSTDTASTTPMLSDVLLTYTNSCTPPGQAYFGNVSVDQYTVTVTAPGYQPYESTVDVSDDTVFMVSMVAN